MAIASTIRVGGIPNSLSIESMNFSIAVSFEETSLPFVITGLRFSD